MHLIAVCHKVLYMTENQQQGEKTPEQIEQETKELINKYCRLNSRIYREDAEETLKERGLDYIKERIKKLEKRHAKPKKVVDKAVMIKGIATAYYLNEKPEMLDLIMKDLQHLGFVDITCAARKGEEGYVYDHHMTFSGRHVDHKVQACFVEAPRTDMLYQYKFAYGQLIMIPFGHEGQKSADCKDLRKLRDLAYLISSAGGRDNLSYLQKTFGDSHHRDAYYWNVVWETSDVKQEQERKAEDELKDRKQKATYEAAGKLDKAADLIRDYIIAAAEYQVEFGEEMRTISEKAVCWRPAVPEVILTATGANLPTLSIAYPQGKELPAQESEDSEEDSQSTEE